MFKPIFRAAADRRRITEACISWLKTVEANHVDDDDRSR